MLAKLRRKHTPNPEPRVPVEWPPWVAYEPRLLPPYELMQSEGIAVLEEWFRWSEEWSMLLRIYGHLRPRSAVLEIGCGLGRIAFPLRYLLGRHGTYTGLDICSNKIDFLEHTFGATYPNFQFHWADVHNTHYNPQGTTQAATYRFPAEDATIDLVFAASVFTHMLPDNAAHYIREAARVLRHGGRCVFSFFLLDYYRTGASRPHGFARPDFSFEHSLNGYGNDFAIAHAEDPERMTAYRSALVQQMVDQAGMELAHAPLPGMWSGSTDAFIGAQDVVVLQKPVPTSGQGCSQC